MNTNERDVQRALPKSHRSLQFPLDPDKIEEIVPPRSHPESDEVEWTDEDWERIWWQTSG